MKDSGRSSGVPEPLPDWKEGAVVWKWALPAHSYIFGITFFAVAMYGLYNLGKLWQTQMRKSRNYFICITVLVCLFGLTRAIVLLADPYSTGRPLHLTPGYGLLLFSLGYPCLTSGFFLVNWSLVEVTKLQLLPSVIHKRKVLALVLLVHFVVVVTFDTIFVFFPSTHILLFICRSFFVLWGILLFGGFIIAARRIREQVKQTLRSITQIETTSRNNSNVDSSTENNTSHVITIATADDNNRFQQARTGKVMKISRRAAATGLLICCTQTYALWEFYVFYNNDVIPKAWPWWIYQTIFRCIELFMVSQMFLIIQPRK
jgi:hypothetical protein